MPIYNKHFTLKEARGWIPELRLKFARIQDLYLETENLQADYMRVKDRIQQNGHAPKVSGFEKQVEALNSEIKEIVDAGIEVKDIVRGLIDFPAMRNGDEVFLCFELSDPDILFWHRIEDGYMGRTPILEDQFVL